MRDGEVRLRARARSLSVYRMINFGLRDTSEVTRPIFGCIDRVSTYECDDCEDEYFKECEEETPVPRTTIF